MFIVAGILLFISYNALDNYLNRNENIIFVSNNEIALMEQSWESKMNRPPTDTERQGFIDQFVKETVLYRTALEMNLDKNDAVVRGRMTQKLKFLGNDLIRSPQPSEQDLVTYYEKHKEEYIPEQMISITHIFFDPDIREDETLDDANKALKILESKPNFDGNIAGYGDAFMLQSYYPKKTELEIRKAFGRGFTESVFQLEADKWHGPVLSGYGTHLVYVHYIQKGEPYTYAEIREELKTDWMEEMQKKLNDKYIEGIMARYEIVFEENTSN